MAISEELELEVKVSEKRKHKPVLVTKSYPTVDGMYANNTDVVDLDIGLAQWDNDEVSAKIWRAICKKISEKPEMKRRVFSRQSEDIPLHRILDLTLLLLEALENSEKISNGTFAREEMRISENESVEVELCENESEKEEKDEKERLKKFVRILTATKNEYLDGRLKTIAKRLKDLGY